MRKLPIENKLYAENFAKFLGGTILNTENLEVEQLLSISKNKLHTNVCDGNFCNYKIIVKDEAEALKMNVPIFLCVNENLIELDNISVDTVFEQVKKMVLEIDGMTEDDFFSNLKNRLKIYREPRQVMQTAIYVAAKNKWPDHVSFEIVGKIFGKNHATIINSLKTVKDLHQTDKFFREKYFSVFEYVRIVNGSFLL